MKARRIAVLTEGRPTYGYCRPIMRVIDQTPELELAVIVTGMHLMEQYGLTLEEVERDGFPIAAKVDMRLEGASPAAWAKSLGIGIQGLAGALDEIRPDVLLVSGDRGEVLAATVAAAYMNIPVAHIQSGDLSGHIDGSARHAITKLCHVHFPSCDDSAERVVKLGEEPWRIFNVGAPQLDEIIRGKRVPLETVMEKLDLRSDEPIVIVVQHPVLAEVEEAADQMRETMEAIRELGIQTVMIYPNVDAASQDLIKVVQEYAHLPFVRLHKSLDREVFITLLEAASMLVGNSSCGILEAPSFKLAAINIGTRQRGRLQASNVINVDHDRVAIAEAMKKALKDEDFLHRLSQCVNPYGDGHSAERVVKVLSEIPLDRRLLHKTMTY